MNKQWIQWQSSLIRKAHNKLTEGRGERLKIERLQTQWKCFFAGPFQARALFVWNEVRFFSLYASSRFSLGGKYSVMNIPFWFHSLGRRPLHASCIAIIWSICYPNSYSEFRLIWLSKTISWVTIRPRGSRNSKIVTMWHEFGYKLNLVGVSKFVGLFIDGSVLNLNYFTYLI